MWKYHKVIFATIHVVGWFEQIKIFKYIFKFEFKFGYISQIIYNKQNQIRDLQFLEKKK